MKPLAWKVVAGLAAAVAAVCAAVAFGMGGCDACVETVSGACMPMKCHWTYQAVVLIEVLAAFALLGLAFVKCKIGRRWLAVEGILAQVAVLVALYSPFMGLCGDTSMHCHQTALVCTILAVVVAILGVVAIAKADPKAASLPRRGL